MSRDTHLHFEHKSPEKPAARGKAKKRKRKAPTKREQKNEPGILWKRFREAAKATDQVIRGHPYESIGIALGVGLLIGVLAGRY